VLSLLGILNHAEVVSDFVDTPSRKSRFDELMDACDSEFEKAVLQKISDLGLPLSTNTQKTISKVDVPIAKPDFEYCENGTSLLIFVDGPDHDKESVKREDEIKRTQLDLMGYNIFVVRYDEDLEKQVFRLGKKLGYSQVPKLLTNLKQKDQTWKT